MTGNPALKTVAVDATQRLTAALESLAGSSPSKAS